MWSISKAIMKRHNMKLYLLLAVLITSISYSQLTYTCKVMSEPNAEDPELKLVIQSTSTDQCSYLDCIVKLNDISKKYFTDKEGILTIDMTRNGCNLFQGSSTEISIYINSNLLYETVIGTEKWAKLVKSDKPVAVDNMENGKHIIVGKTIKGTYYPIIATIGDMIKINFNNIEGYVDKGEVEVVDHPPLHPLYPNMVLINQQNQSNVYKYFISAFLVTVKDFRNFCSATGYIMPPEPPWGWSENAPIVNVTWYDAIEYTRWAGGRLPNEAEWKFAALGNANNNYSFSGSDNIDSVAWWNENAGGITHNVGAKQPNEFGLYDMSGNVWEWCSDYSSTGSDNSSQKSYILRGGSWMSDKEECRLSVIRKAPSNTKASNIGFRLIQDTP
jgi:hypothetical protein